MPPPFGRPSPSLPGVYTGGGFFDEGGTAQYPTAVFQKSLHFVQAWANYLSFPENYRRIKIDRIQHYKSAKRPKQAYTALRNFIRDCHNGKMSPNWSDIAPGSSRPGRVYREYRCRGHCQKGLS